MSYSLRQEWRALWDCPSGERFERRYRRARRLQDHHEFLPRVFRLFLAVVIFAMGVGAIFLPFPEIILFAASGALLAAESLALARFLDRVELGASRQWEWFQHRSGLPPLVVRMVTVALPICSLGISGCFCCQVFLP
jgi:hypothetical protein